MMRPIKYCIATALALSAVAWAGQPAITGAAAEKSVIVQTNSAVNPVTQYGIVIVAVPQATVYADPALTQPTGRLLPHGSNWATTVAGQDSTGKTVSYRVSTHEWLAAKDITTLPNAVAVREKENGTVTIFRSNGARTYAAPFSEQANGSLPYGSNWRYTGVVKNGYGAFQFFQVSTHQWVLASDAKQTSFVKPAGGIVTVTAPGEINTRTLAGGINGRLAAGTAWRYTGLLYDTSGRTNVLIGYQVSRDQFVAPAGVKVQ